MNKQFKQKYKTILESKIANLQESAPPPRRGGWGRFGQLLVRNPAFGQGFRDLDDLRQFVILRRLNRMEGRSHIFVFRNSDPPSISKLNQDYPQFGGSIKQLIITEDGAHLIPFGHNPIQYYYLPGPVGATPIPLPDWFNPHIHEVPGHTPWINPNGTVNEDFKFPVFLPPLLTPLIPILFDEPASANPNSSPANPYSPYEVPQGLPQLPPNLLPIDPNDPWINDQVYGG